MNEPNWFATYVKFPKLSTMKSLPLELEIPVQRVIKERHTIPRLPLLLRPNYSHEYTLHCIIVTRIGHSSTTLNEDAAEPTVAAGVFSDVEPRSLQIFNCTHIAKTRSAELLRNATRITRRQMCAYVARKEYFNTQSFSGFLLLKLQMYI